MREALLLSLLLSACGGDTEDTDTNERPGQGETDPSVHVNLLSPADGASYAADEAIPLSVEARRDGQALAVTSAVWTIGSWSGRGAETEATGLSAGEYTVNVEVVVEGATYTDAVGITVTAPAGPSLYHYAGTFEADVDISTADYGDFSDSCRSALTFTVEDGAIAGAGRCDVFADFGLDPLQFTLEGTVAGGRVSGDLVMDVDGSEERTPFSGTGNAGSTLTATFDNSFRSGSDSLRFSGSWTADPE